MYFDFEDYHPDVQPIGRAISAREGVLISIIVHLAVLSGVLLWLRFPPSADARQMALLSKPQPDEATRFVWVNPRVDTPALKAPDRADPSDKDRTARTVERPEKPENPAPFSRGNSPERVEAPPPPELSRGSGPEPEPQQGQSAPQQSEPSAPEPPVKLPETQSAMAYPTNRTPQPQTGALGRSPLSGGSLGETLRNLHQFLDQSQFKNPQGGVGQRGDAIQFDTKGVEFGPWVRRFVERVRSNWNVPLAAMSLSGHVVITFNIHKNGAITDLNVQAPCPVQSFNTAAYGALVASNPTEPLPPEYPDEQAFFTVTFYYNEQVR